MLFIRFSTPKEGFFLSYCVTSVDLYQLFQIIVFGAIKESKAEYNGFSFQPERTDCKIKFEYILNITFMN